MYIFLLECTNCKQILRSLSQQVKFSCLQNEPNSFNRFINYDVNKRIHIFQLTVNNNTSGIVVLLCVLEIPVLYDDCPQTTSIVIDVDNLSDQMIVLLSLGRNDFFCNL